MEEPDEFTEFVEFDTDTSLVNTGQGPIDAFLLMTL